MGIVIDKHVEDKTLVVTFKQDQAERLLDIVIAAGTDPDFDYTMFTGRDMRVFMTAFTEVVAYLTALTSDMGDELGDDDEWVTIKTIDLK